MPPKKKHRGGRPKGDYSCLDAEEKKLYHSKAVRSHRGLNSPSASVIVTENQESSTPPQGTPKRGRPPLNDSAMTPNTLKCRVSTLNSDRRRKEKLSLIRRNSAMARWKDDEPSDEPSSESDIDLSCYVNNVPELTDGTPFSKSKLYELRSTMDSILTSSPIDNIQCFAMCAQYFHLTEFHFPEIAELSEGGLTVRQLRYRRDQLQEKVFCFLKDKTSQEFILKYWINKLIDSPIGLAIVKTWEFSPDYLPKTLSLTSIARDICQTILQRHNTSAAQRIQGVTFLIEVAKKGCLTTQHGDITALSQATNCSRAFAKTVLLAIEAGTEAQLLTRNMRCDAIKATAWPEEISRFVLDPENSRAVPGQEGVSVRYGVRRPKYVLLDSRENIAKKFKDSNPGCPFSISVICREFPQNAVSASKRERERNTCPIHANARRLLKCLHQNKVGKGIGMSCREMCSLTLCVDETVNISEPLTWKEDCVFGVCNACSTPKLEVPDNIKKISVTYSSWQHGEKVQETKKKSKDGIESEKEIKGKKVFGLFPITTTVEAVASTFLGSLGKLKRHIYIAHKQWDAHASARKSLTVNSLITIEDYQRNIEVEYIEQPTSMAYSSNKLTVAVYPICLEFKTDPAGPVHKGAITFISDDKVHDHQQVQAFEKRMFQMIREDFGMVIQHWQRWSDGCGAQFKSKFVNHDLLQAPDTFHLNSASFSYFEAHEGKNTSDTIGSIVKCAFLKGIAKDDKGIGKAGDVVELVRKNVKAETKKFDFFIVEEFPFMDRIDENERETFEITGISKVHQLFVRDGGLVADEWSCTSCTPSSLCPECLTKDYWQLECEEEEVDEDEEGERIHDDEDLGHSDEESEDESDDDDEVFAGNSNFSPGDVVWAKWGRKCFPAKVISYKELESSIKTKLSRSKKTHDYVVVQWYGENNYNWVNVKNMYELSENRCDAANAAKSEDIHQRYQLALADLRND